MSLFSKIDTFILRVSDIVASKQWYEEVLELSPSYESQGEHPIVVFSLGSGSSLTLYQWLKDEEIIELDSNNYLFPGTTNLYEVEDILNVELPTQEYDTLSGFVIGQLGYIPDGNDHPSIEYQNITFQVEEMDELRIMKVKVSIKEESQEEE